MPPASGAADQRDRLLLCHRILKAGLDRASSADRESRQPSTPTSAAPPITSEGKEERMLTNPTLDQMQALGLAGMAAAWRELAERNNATSLAVMSGSA